MQNKFIYNKKYRLSLLVLLITISVGILWSNSSINLTFFNWAIDFITIITLLQYRKVGSYYKFIDAFFFWLLISIIRGVFIAENYWEWKQLIIGTFSLSLPLFVYAFDKPDVVSCVLRYWFKYAIPLFLLFIFILSNGTYHFYLGPIFVIGCFIPIIPKKWKFIIGGLLVIMLFINLGARSQVIKSAVVLLVTLGVYLRRFISVKILKFLHASCYLLPIILLYLGISGTFNIFQDLSSNEGKYIEKKIVNGQIQEDDLSADTRTFIYVEVIESALRHNYVIWGRTPARGNDSASFGSYNAEKLKTGKYERHFNELCHTNIFTWLGLIGVILYSFIYFRSSYLAVYKSNNIYVKYLGCFIAFRWAYGWIEDFNQFDIMNISLWMMIAMGISFRFRSLSNKQFKLWLNSIFNKNI